MEAGKLWCRGTPGSGSLEKGFEQPASSKESRTIFKRKGGNMQVRNKVCNDNYSGQTILSHVCINSAAVNRLVDG